MYRQGKKSKRCWVSLYSSEISVVVGDVKVQVLHANELGAADETDCKILNESEKKSLSSLSYQLSEINFIHFKLLKRNHFKQKD